MELVEHFPDPADQARDPRLPAMVALPRARNDVPPRRSAQCVPPVDGERRLLAELLDAGFGQLFENQAAAESFLGDKAHPAPLGNVTKAKPDGSCRHRLIMDLRRNQVAPRGAR